MYARVPETERKEIRPEDAYVAHIQDRGIHATNQNPLYVAQVV